MHWITALTGLRCGFNLHLDLTWTAGKKHTEQEEVSFSGLGSADRESASEKSLAVVNKLLLSRAAEQQRPVRDCEQRADMSVETAASGKSPQTWSTNVRSGLISVKKPLLKLGTAVFFLTCRPSDAKAKAPGAFRYTQFSSQYINSVLHSCKVHSWASSQLY